MNRITFKRFLMMLLAVVMVIGMIPAAVFATEEETESTLTETTETTAEETVVEDASADEQTVAATALVESGLYDTSVSSDYFTVISADTYALAPGAQEHEIVLNNAEGSDRKVVHVFEVDTNNEELEVMPGYYGIDQLNADDLAGDSAIWKAEQLTKTVAYYEDTLGYNVVGAMNTALAYDSNAPYGYMVWNGVVLGTPEVHKGAQTYLAINWDGTCELRSMSTALTGNEKTAISANFGWLVKDGALTSTTVERTSSDASRSMIGIKADGTLIFCQVDGRNGAVSSGLSNYEMGEMMLALGCVNAVNCDGGGSSTFVSKRAGESENTMRSVPSDGSERPTINSVILVSTAGATGEFAQALIETEYDYIAPTASMPFEVTALDTKGFTMALPAEVTYQVAEEGMGTVADGVFTAGSTTGTATIQAVYNGTVVGEKVVNVVHPESFAFSADSTVLPYGKSAELVVEATYGADNWTVVIDGAYTLTLSDETAATLAGNVLTAPEDTAIAGVNVTATYLPDTTMTDELVVAYGKGSEILFDFEDGSVDGWMGFQDAKQWSIDNGVNNTLVGTAPMAGQFNEQIGSTTFLSSVENGGKVKNGQYALAWSLDNTDADFAGWSYNILFYVGEQIVLRDTANGNNATTLGMWLYIPENAPGLAFQSQLYTAEAACKQSHFTFTTASGASKYLNQCTEADIPESRWVYVTIDLTAYDYIATPNPTDTTSSRSPSIVRTYVKPTEPAVITFFIDDITLDYSSAVEDRVLPTVSNVAYATADAAVSLEEGAEISGTSIGFSANVADNAGLNTATGVILVDGVALKTTVSGGVMSSENTVLNPGVHTVSFEIQDKLGNLGKVTRTFTVTGDALVTLSGHNDSGTAPEYDSIYYADINVADIASIDTLTATIYLQTANTWEPQGIQVAEGFQAEYYHNTVANELTVTVKRVEDTALTGAQTLVSLPIRVWSWNGVNNVTGEAIKPETHFATGYCPIVQIRYEVLKGTVTLTADNGALGAFGGACTVDTNLNDNVNPWHYHDSELAVLNQEATCIVDGYEGRTYCQTCQSVIDWGTKLPATGHAPVVVDTQLVCDCGYIVTGTGIVEASGKLYCLIADNLVTGWQAVGNDWCYADPTTMEVQTGEFTVDSLTYTADEGGIVVKGAWYTDSNGTKYSYGPQFYTREWAEIDGAKYYFGTDSYMYTGIRAIVVNRNNIKEGYRVYKFAEDGKLEDEMLDANGIIATNGDGIFYVVNGTSVYGGLMLIDGDYYYARTSGQLVTGKQYWITKNNDLLPVGYYTFDENGKMVDPPVVDGGDSGDSGDSGETEEPEVTVKNGIYADENGVLCYYENDVKTYGGLMLIDGNYYYARSSGKLAVSCKYWITKNNDLLPVGYYNFDETGKMIDAPVVDEGGDDSGDTGDSGETEEPEVTVKNGIYADENGVLCYYENDVKTYGGLMLIDGNYYYARSSGKLAVSCKYWVTKNNDLLPVGYYNFDETGKMTDAPVVDEGGDDSGNTGDSGETEEPEVTVKNGVCADENGVLYYYVNDVKTYGGLLHLDTDGDGVADTYYYARTSGQIVVSKKYWISKTNDLLPAGYYTFDENGKMTDAPTV